MKVYLESSNCAKCGRKPWTNHETFILLDRLPEKHEKLLLCPECEKEWNVFCDKINLKSNDPIKVIYEGWKNFIGKYKEVVQFT